MLPIIKIRRRAYHMDNPVCNTGSEIHPHAAQLRKELNYFAVPENMGVLSYPRAVLRLHGVIHAQDLRSCVYKSKYRQSQKAESLNY